jgi:outer membrane protein assembly factor BamB
VILGDLAITLGERAVYGVDLATGEVSWEVPRAGGPLSVPAVVAATGGEPATLLYLDGPGGDASVTPTPSATGSPSGATATADSSAGSELVAIELDGRTELWRAPLGATSRSGVAVQGDIAYVGDEDGVAAAVALDDGSVRWTSDVREADDPCVGLPDGRIDVPLAVADGRVVAVARNVDGASVALFAFDATTGECIWQHSPQVRSSAASAAAARDGRVVIGLADRLVRALGGSDGEQSWASLALSVFSPASSPALGPDAVYVVDLGGGVYRLEAEDGRRVWDHQLNEIVVRSSPVVSGGTVLVGLSDGRLVALDDASGRLVWQSAATPGLVGAIALSSEVVVAVKGGREAGLIAFEHDPGGALVDVASPTELELATLFVRAGAAAAVVLVVLLVPGMLASRRFGGAFPEEPDAGEPEGGEVES